jgi:hypothetical protein
MLNGVLRCCVKFLWWGGMWAMLWFEWGLMVEPGKQSYNIPWHGNIDMAFVVVPFESNAAIECASPVSLDFKESLYGGNEMVDVLFADILNSKIVDGEREMHRVGDMLPKAWCVGNFVVSRWA